MKFLSILAESEDLFSLIEAHEGRPLKLYVYNTETDHCREVIRQHSAALILVTTIQIKTFLGNNHPKWSLGRRRKFRMRHRLWLSPSYPGGQPSGISAAAVGAVGGTTSDDQRDGESSATE